MAQVKRTKAQMKADGAAAATMSDAEADALIAQCGRAMNALERLKAEANDAVAALKKEFEDRGESDKQIVVDTYARLAVWATAHRKRLTDDGAKKTVALPSGELIWRSRPASVQIRRGMKEEDIVAQAAKLRLGRFLRVTHELNRQALLADPEAAQLLDGVKIKSAGETFDVAPAGIALSEPKE